MPEIVDFQLRLPADVATSLRNGAHADETDEERIRVSLAIGLFAQRVMSLAKAASLAAMSRHEFALLLKRIGLAAYEYTETECQDDLAFAASVKEP